MKILFYNHCLDSVAHLLLEELFKAKFPKETIDFKITTNADILIGIIDVFKPDLLFTHCHSKGCDFDKIRLLTNNYRKSNPNSVIIVGFHDDVGLKYKETNLIGYECDLIIQDSSLFPSDLELIYDIYINKIYH